MAKSFGRRIDPRFRQAGNQTEVAASKAERIVASPPSSEETAAPSPDEELLAWTKARSFKVPWRQVWLMASLCFGIASFVLPDTVNDNVQWLLYAAAAASLYGGFAKRRNPDRPDN